MQEVERRLYRYGELIRRIQDTEEEIKGQVSSKIEMLDALLRAPQPDHVRVQGGERADPVYNTVEKMIDVYDERIGRLQEQLRSLFYDHDELCRWIDGAGLSENEYSYLRQRYVERTASQDIADCQGYSTRHVERIKRGMLKKLYV